jgi:hypothetical protein
VDDPAIFISAIVQDPHIQPEHGMLRPFQYLHKLIAAVNNHAGNIKGGIVPLR